MFLPHPDDHQSSLITGRTHLARAVERLIVDAEFDEHDRDIGTGGLCGTFAIALHTTLLESGIRATPTLAYVGGIPSDISEISWRHALIAVDGALFDIDGHVLPEHVLENYCWGTTSKIFGLIELEFVDFAKLIKSTRNAFDAAWLRQWTSQLARNANDLLPLR